MGFDHRMLGMFLLAAIGLGTDQGIGFSESKQTSTPRTRLSVWVCSEQYLTALNSTLGHLSSGVVLFSMLTVWSQHHRVQSSLLSDGEVPRCQIFNGLPAPPERSAGAPSWYSPPRSLESLSFPSPVSQTKLPNGVSAVSCETTNERKWNQNTSPLC